ncbi:MAG: Wzz/FepE/Etk N-terminal domain-containing protein [Pirellulaceae bacterium]
MRNELFSNTPRDDEPAIGARGNQDLLQINDIIQFIHFAKRHWLRIITAILICVGAAILYCVRSTPLYESTAQLLVVKKTPLSVDGFQAGLPQSNESMSSHIALIKSPWLASRVLSEQSPVDSLETFRDEKDPVQVLRKALTVVHENDTDRNQFSTSHVLRFEFKGRSADECPVLLRSIICVYQQHLNETNVSANQAAIDLIGKKVEQIKKDLATKEREYNQFRENSPLLLTENRSTVFLQQQLTNIDQALLELNQRQAETISRIQAVRNAVADEGNTEQLRGLLPTPYVPLAGNHISERILALQMEQKNWTNALAKGIQPSKQFKTNWHWLKSSKSQVHRISASYWFTLGENTSAC